MTFKLREDNDVLSHAAELHLMSTTDDEVQETAGFPAAAIE